MSYFELLEEFKSMGEKHLKYMSSIYKEIEQINESLKSSLKPFDIEFTYKVDDYNTFAFRHDIRWIAQDGEHVAILDCDFEICELFDTHKHPFLQALHDFLINEGY